MTASRRLLPPSPAAPLSPLEVEDLLIEILLRLSPLPSSLPRASAVCKRWRHLISDPDFLVRFRLHHRPNPPLLGFFVTDWMRCLIGFLPLVRPGVPDLVRTNCFCQNHQILSCRHGLLLIFLVKESQFQVWDPVTGVRHLIDPPPAQSLPAWVNGEVLRDARDDDHFKIVLADVEGPRAIACVYSSETSKWGDLVSAVLPPRASIGGPPAMKFSRMNALLVEKSLYWLLFDVPTNFSEAFRGVLCASSILEFDVERQSLSVDRVPANLHHPKDHEISVIKERGVGLCLLIVSGCHVHIWKRKREHNGGTSWVLGITTKLRHLLSPDPQNNGGTSWVLGRTIKLRHLLSPDPQNYAGQISINAFAEYNHVVLLSTSIYYYTVELESLEVRRFQCRGSRYHPFESVYTTGNGGWPDAADLHSMLKRMVR
ncbi:uncharacterized protein [Aegilops tauschii subsp. strangulata]|nr:uncharacterized protein LOC120966103 [Aegilops tauschii subsp. strangulata]